MKMSDTDEKTLDLGADSAILETFNALPKSERQAIIRTCIANGVIRESLLPMKSVRAANQEGELCGLTRRDVLRHYASTIGVAAVLQIKEASKSTPAVASAQNENCAPSAPVAVREVPELRQAAGASAAAIEPVSEQIEVTEPREAAPGVPDVFVWVPASLVRSALFSGIPQSSTRKVEYNVSEIQEAKSNIVRMQASDGMFRQGDFILLCWILSKARPDDSKSFDFTPTDAMRGTGRNCDCRKSVENEFLRLATRNFMAAKREGDSLPDFSKVCFFDQARCITIRARKERGVIGKNIYRLTFDKTFRDFYQMHADQKYLTKINLTQLAKLPAGPATWLYAYISSFGHKYTLKTTAAELLALSGASSTREPKDLRRDLKSALARLVDIGAIRSFDMGRDGSLTIER